MRSNILALVRSNRFKNIAIFFVIMFISSLFVSLVLWYFNFLEFRALDERLSSVINTMNNDECKGVLMCMRASDCPPLPINKQTGFVDTTCDANNCFYSVNYFASNMWLDRAQAVCKSFLRNTDLTPCIVSEALMKENSMIGCGYGPVILT